MLSNQSSTEAFKKIIDNIDFIGATVRKFYLITFYQNNLKPFFRVESGILMVDVLVKYLLNNLLVR